MESPVYSEGAEVLRQTSSNSSSRQSSGKQYAGADSSQARELDRKELLLGGGEEEYDSLQHKRSLESQDQDDDPAKEDQDDAEYRRMRRRITNRESAKRMRIKRQEELANFQKELKRVSLENEQLRRYSAHLQKQHMMMATDIQHWQNKYTSANAEVTALFQQLQQVVALSAAFNPAILDAVGKTAGSSQGPIVNALRHALPQARILSEALEALRTTGSVAPSMTSLSTYMPSGPTSIANLPVTGGLPAGGVLPSTGPLSAANFTAIRLAAAAHAEARGGSSAAPRQTQETGAGVTNDVLQPRPLRPTPSTCTSQAVDADALAPAPLLLANADTGEPLNGLSEQQANPSTSNISGLELEAVLKAAQQRVAATH